jgi:hypothetical protein
MQKWLGHKFLKFLKFPNDSAKSRGSELSSTRGGLCIDAEAPLNFQALILSSSNLSRELGRVKLLSPAKSYFRGYRRSRPGKADTRLVMSSWNSSYTGIYSDTNAIIILNCIPNYSLAKSLGTEQKKDNGRERSQTPHPKIFGFEGKRKECLGNKNVIFILHLIFEPCENFVLVLCKPLVPIKEKPLWALPNTDWRISRLVIRFAASPIWSRK